MNASFENATSVIRGLEEHKTKLRTKCGLLTAKIAGTMKQHEETTALLQRTGVIVRKLMDENAMLCIESQRLVEEYMDALKQCPKYTKALNSARREN